MDFLESDEQTLLRASVYRIAAQYGHEYYAREARGAVRQTLSGKSWLKPASWA